jgi:hypothetical protein
MATISPTHGAACDKKHRCMRAIDRSWEVVPGGSCIGHVDKPMRRRKSGGRKVTDKEDFQRQAAHGGKTRGRQVLGAGIGGAIREDLFRFRLYIIKACNHKELIFRDRLREPTINNHVESKLNRRSIYYQFSSFLFFSFCHSFGALARKTPVILHYRSPLHRLVVKAGHFFGALTRSLTVSKSRLCCMANRLATPLGNDVRIVIVDVQQG